MRKKKQTVAERIIDKAFKKAKEASRQKFEGDLVTKSKKKEIVRINTVYNVVINEINSLILNVPKERVLNDFYRELIEVYVPWKVIKKSIERLNYIKKFIREFYIHYKNSIKITRDTRQIANLRREFYGKVASILKRNKKHLEVLYEIQVKFQRFPKIKAYPTVVIAGLPNVGKSTLLKKLTGSKPEIQPYPFTTKDLMLGYLETPYFTIQFIDTPGILDRPLDKLNQIEKKAALALKHLANVIIYVIDLTETCGFDLKQQLNLLEQIKKYFRKELVIYFSKFDLFSKDELEKLEKLKNEISVNWFTSPEDLKKYLINYIKRKREWYF